MDFVSFRLTKYAINGRLAQNAREKQKIELRPGEAVELAFTLTVEDPEWSPEYRFKFFPKLWIPKKSKMDFTFGWKLSRDFSDGFIFVEMPAKAVGMRTRQTKITSLPLMPLSKSPDEPRQYRLELIDCGGTFGSRCSKLGQPVELSMVFK